MRATLAVAALPMAAQAIMIPSTNSMPELTSALIIDPKGQLLKVDCPGCQFASNDEGKVTWSHAVENALVLNISVGAAPETLELNGVRFYPPVMSLTSENPAPYIPQVPAGMGMTEIRKNSEELAKHALRLTNWAFQAGHSQTVSETGEELLTIHLQLYALERQEINVPDIAITTLKNADGELAILNVETKEKKEPARQECRDWPLLCKWRDILGDKLGMGFDFPALPKFAVGGKPPCTKGRHGSKGQGHGRFPPHKGARPHGGPPFGREHAHPPFDREHAPTPMDGEIPPPPFPGRHGKHHGHGGRPNGTGAGKGHGPHPHHHHPHHHHHHHGSKLHRVLHMVGRVVLTFLVPALVAIAAGMVTYLLGMIIGAAIAAVYLKVRGRRAARYQAISLEEEDDDDETPRSSIEKVDFKGGDDEDPLPVYTEKEVC